MGSDPGGHYLSNTANHINFEPKIIMVSLTSGKIPKILKEIQESLHSKMVELGFNFK